MSGRHGLEIRAATSADAPGLAELLDAAGLRVPAAEMAERLEALRRAQGSALLALEWGPPSGLVVLQRYPVLTLPAPVARITTLLVGPGERRRGLGRLLVKAAARSARLAGCDTLLIDVAPQCASQEDLRAFCEATGFSATAEGLSRPLRKRS